MVEVVEEEDTRKRRADLELSSGRVSWARAEKEKERSRTEILIVKLRSRDVLRVLLWRTGENSSARQRVVIGYLMAREDSVSRGECLLYSYRGTCQSLYSMV